MDCALPGNRTVVFVGGLPLDLAGLGARDLLLLLGLVGIGCGRRLRDLRVVELVVERCSPGAQPDPNSALFRVRGRTTEIPGEPAAAAAVLQRTQTSAQRVDKVVQLAVLLLRLDAFRLGLDRLCAVHKPSDCTRMRRWPCDSHNGRVRRTRTVSSFFFICCSLTLSAATSSRVFCGRPATRYA